MWPLWFFSDERQCCLLRYGQETYGLGWNFVYANPAFELSNQSSKHIRNPYCFTCLVMCWVLAEDERGDYTQLQKRQTHFSNRWWLFQGDVYREPWVHAGGHSAPLLKEMLSEVALEIEFPSIRQISGEGGFRSRVRKYETALSKTQNHDPAWGVQVPVGRVVWNSWKVEQLEIMSENKGRAISPKASYSKWRGCRYGDSCQRLSVRSDRIRFAV